MTREEKLYTMRGKDLVQYCINNGIRVDQTRGNLKESKKAVIDRILAFEAGTPEPEWKAETDQMISEYKKDLRNNPKGDASKYIDWLLEQEADVVIYFMEQTTK